MENLTEALSWINLRFLLQGFWVTIEVSVISIILSFVIGLALGLIRFTRIDAKTTRISKVVGVIIDIIRNLPLLLIIFFSYFGLPVMGIRVDTVQASVIAMVVFESAMIAEVVRSGIMAVDPGQMEGARSNGMTYMQAMTHVVLPQALTKMIPALLSQFVSLIKDTSLATIIVLPELLYHAEIIYNQNTNYMIPMYLAVAVMYFIICFALSSFANYLSKRIKY
ncbi:glutamine ABC transporter permease [Lactobacillus delbrueckii subsp. delbrueckii DSM 20074 = JCM 1012]|uniref:amino acid ABC transporter permease n=1 Tax=Lactobacillus delbrueckii TaxID=1584 RepID=UPI00046F736A|nr:amino acid ABC transporter permease [Lactobacillus delbrueckii]APP09331.1 glutamine ABC transporter permease [Lactobacillus delbrueckii subsp. delbrueckii DSM 20074 = JCM 1012]APP10805.1 glutamine ABC transporter permease [Lactobacillus delbrueckii subsp. delbrueckii DSM 20074 = JCM 1012]KNZ38516.1 glutamine ABC transporter permease [Lactobacillus delbrueckii subsp. delbrueckii]KRK26036.1 glutamine ABC transporter permease [Lactobacillus delbrueckii subsp. delbrueckii DSM 20074 = JCM 1012]M